MWRRRSASRPRRTRGRARRAASRLVPISFSFLFLVALCCLPCNHVPVCVRLPGLHFVPGCRSRCSPHSEPREQAVRELRLPPAVYQLKRAVKIDKAIRIVGTGGPGSVILVAGGKFACIEVKVGTKSTHGPPCCELLK